MRCARPSAIAGCITGAFPTGERFEVGKSEKLADAGCRTTLGATYVAMFPETAERVILDGGTLFSVVLAFSHLS